MAGKAKPRDEWTEERRCPAINKRGERCKRYAAPGDDFCSAHDPRRAELRKVAAAKAGKAFHPARESAQIRRRILALAQEVRDGKVEPQIAYAFSALCNTAIGTLRIDLKVKEMEEIDKRLDTLEARLQESGEIEVSPGPRATGSGEARAGA